MFLSQVGVTDELDPPILEDMEGDAGPERGRHPFRSLDRDAVVAGEELVHRAFPADGDLYQLRLQTV